METLGGPQIDTLSGEAFSTPQNLSALEVQQAIIAKEIAENLLKAGQ